MNSRVRPFTVLKSAVGGLNVWGWLCVCRLLYGILLAHLREHVWCSVGGSAAVRPMAATRMAPVAVKVEVLSLSMLFWVRMSVIRG